MEPDKLHSFQLRFYFSYEISPWIFKKYALKRGQHGQLSQRSVMNQRLLLTYRTVKALSLLFEGTGLSLWSCTMLVTGLR